MFEGVLQRVLQAVFGGGSSIDIKAAQDGLQSVDRAFREGRSLNNFYRGFVTPPGGGAEVLDMDTYCTLAGITIPAGYRHLQFSSRTHRMYPSVSFLTQLSVSALTPDLLFEFLVWSGTEGFPAVEFGTHGDAAAFNTGRAGFPHLLGVTDLLPADCNTARHLYTIKVSRSMSELWIDENIVAVCLHDLPEAIPDWDNNPPYALGSSEIVIAGGSLRVGVILDNNGDTALLPLNIFHGRIGLTDGDPTPPRQYPLYTESTATEWKGLATAIAVTSHPVPVWGYPRKTLVFQANAAGNLDIQVYSGGGWRSWVPGGITLVANQFEVYNLNGEVPIARCIYTPVGADTITLAEWYLS